mgnify:CR=1 FL=1
MKKINIFFIVILCCLAYSLFHIPNQADRMLGQLPVMHEGRVKPLDTLARHYLLQIQGRLRLPDASPTQWFYQLITNSESKHQDWPIILVEHPNIFASINPQYRKQKFRVSETFVSQHLEHILPLVKEAEMLEKEQRSPLQQAAYLVYQRYQRIQELRGSFFPIEEGSPLKFWNNMLAVSQHVKETSLSNSKELQIFMQYYSTLKQAVPEPLLTFTEDGHWDSLANAALQPNQFDHEQLSQYLLLADRWPDASALKYSEAILKTFKAQNMRSYYQLKLEYYFNILNPFMVSLFVYFLMVFMSFLASFIKNKSLPSLIHMAWIFALLFHGFGLVSRSIILLRPPVINLYSSSIFIAFVCSLIGFFLYRRSQILFYAGYLAALSALSLMVAYHLSLSGDTMEVMQAVLNSNFWLSTHVVSMTIGYALIFMVGFFAIAYILMGTLTSKLTPHLEKGLSQMVYIFLMISLFFNFLGTVLGGIWADQSWGRFWGWDPKENGAILIVIWIAIMLHMKWGRLISSRGLMILAVFANIVTAWSWKGTNMLGIGLHSYGFTEKTFYWLSLFFVSQLIIMLMGALPLRYWRSGNLFEK